MAWGFYKYILGHWETDKSVQPGAACGPPGNDPSWLRSSWSPHPLRTHPSKIGSIATWLKMVLTPIGDSSDPGEVSLRSRRNTMVAVFRSDIDEKFPSHYLVNSFCKKIAVNINIFYRTD